MSLTVAIGIPAYRRQVHVGHLFQVSQLTKQLLTFGRKCPTPGCGAVVPHHMAYCGYCGKQVQVPIQAAKFQVMFTDSCAIDWSRNMLVYHALKARADWLLMIDADTYHPQAEDIMRMIGDGEAKGATVIAAPVLMRNRPGYNVEVMRGDEEIQLQREEFAGTVRQVDRIGTAFMAISTRWIAKCWPVAPWFECRQFAGQDGMPSWLGEDYKFCDGVRDRGGSIYVDGRFEPSHEGTVSETAAFAAMDMEVISREECRARPADVLAARSAAVLHAVGKANGVVAR